MKKLLFSLGITLFLSCHAFAADMTVFGIELGKPLALPECEMENSPRLGRIVKLPVKTMCVEAEASGRFGYPHKVRHVIVPKPEVPEIMGGNLMPLLEENGILQGIEFFTYGIETQDLVFSALKKKYGKPTFIESYKVRSKAGASFDTMRAIWRMKDVEVAFSGVTHDLKSGSVIVSTRRGVEIREGWRQEREKGKLEL